MTIINDTGAPYGSEYFSIENPAPTKKMIHNPFTGKDEVFDAFGNDHVILYKLLQSAADRINAMQAEIDALKSRSTWRPDVDA